MLRGPKGGSRTEGGGFSLSHHIVDESSHRAAFLLFIVSLIGTEVEVEVLDGRKFWGIFHTGMRS